ncbi:MAG: PKD domain-containing protein [Thermoplasmata archaeon]|nr:MAG: PKD domain-containing protein [Thermoplasmata archaeon]
MEESYTYNLKFEEDGKTSHYVVSRHDTGEPALITLTYWTQDNKLDITNVKNIKTLEIDVQSMFEDESNDVFKQTHDKIPTMDMDYWLDANDGIFTIEFDIDSEEPMEELTFTKFPTPVSVKVNSQEWWGTTSKYNINDNQITISDIPTGVTTVIIYFKEANLSPIPSFIVKPSTTAGVNENLTFNATASSDPDGSIIGWIWSFGDNTTESGKPVVWHIYSTPGTYTAKLTVRDNAVPYAEAWVEKQIIVEYGAEEDNDGDGLRDKWEWDNFENLDQNGEGDPDNDGYPNALEQLAGTDPTNDGSFTVDSDSDGLDDLWEWDYFDSLKETAEGDFDGDGASNKLEQDKGTDPIDELDFPPTEKGAAEKEGMNFMLILILIIIIIAVLAIAMGIRRSKKQREKVVEEPMEVEEEEPEIVEAETVDEIAEIEARIEEARAMGLPTGDLKKVLKEAKMSSGALPPERPKGLKKEKPKDMKKERPKDKKKEKPKEKKKGPPKRTSKKRAKEIDWDEEDLEE